MHAMMPFVWWTETETDDVMTFPNIRNFPVDGGKQLLPGGTLIGTVQPEKIEWLSPGRIAVGKLTIIDGDPGLGKSVITVDCAARITRGIPLIGAEGCHDGPSLKPRGVVLMCHEDGLADTITPRVLAAGGDGMRMLRFDMQDDDGHEHMPNIDEHLWAIEHQIQAMDAALLVIDPIMAYFGGRVKSNNDQDVRSVLMPLAHMAEVNRCAVIILRHLNKASGSSSMYRGGGSIGIVAATRIGLVVGKDQKDETGQRRFLAVNKINVSVESPTLVYRVVNDERYDTAKIEWLGESDIRADEVIASQDMVEHHDMTESQKWLFGYLSSGSQPANDVFREAKKAGFGERTIKQAKASLKVQSDREGFGPGSTYTWKLPDAQPDPWFEE